MRPPSAARVAAVCKRAGKAPSRARRGDPTLIVKLLVINARPSPFRPDALSGMLTRAWIVARTYPRGRAACKGSRVTTAAMAPSCSPSTRRPRGSPLGTLIHPVALSGDHARTRLHALGLVEGRPGALRLHDGVTQLNLQNLFR